MPTFIVYETLTLVRYVEAADEQAAIEKAKEEGAGDFDHVDCSPKGANSWRVERDDSAA